MAFTVTMPCIQGLQCVCTQGLQQTTTSNLAIPIGGPDNPRDEDYYAGSLDNPVACDLFSGRTLRCADTWKFSFSLFTLHSLYKRLVLVGSTSTCVCFHSPTVLLSTPIYLLEHAGTNLFLHYIKLAASWQTGKPFTEPGEQFAASSLCLHASCQGYGGSWVVLQPENFGILQSSGTAVPPQELLDLRPELAYDIDRTPILREVYFALLKKSCTSTFGMTISSSVTPNNTN